MAAGTDILQSMNAQARHRIDVGTGPLVIGRELGLAFDKLRRQQDQQPADGQKIHPADVVLVVGALVVALDGDAGNAGLLQFLQRGNGLVERQGVDRALVEEIAGQDDKVDLLGDGRIDDGEKGAGKIIAAFGTVVLLVAEMNVGTVKKSSFHGPLFTV